jgi:hypothetical protein
MGIREGVETRELQKLYQRLTGSLYDPCGYPNQPQNEANQMSPPHCLPFSTPAAALKSTKYSLYRYGVVKILPKPKNKLEETLIYVVYCLSL